MERNKLIFQEEACLSVLVSDSNSYFLLNLETYHDLEMM
jgi:hypothetical protein